MESGNTRYAITVNNILIQKINQNLQESITHKFGEIGATNFHPITILLLIICIISIFILSDKYAIAPVVISLILIPFSQKIVLFDTDFTLFRILIIIVLIKIVLMSGLKYIDINIIDICILFYVIVSVAAYTLLWMDISAFKYKLGFALNILGVYFMFRIFIKDDKDVVFFIELLIVIASLVAINMIYEQITGNNPFSIFGGVPEFVINREGNLRAQGPFAHAILAGTFGATTFPLILSLWWKKWVSRPFIYFGLTATTIITVLSYSSTPVLAYIASIIGFGFWIFRNKMKTVRWFFVILLLSLHIVMKAPVWFLIQRVSVIGGSSGYQRAKIVDLFISNYSEWWFIGTKFTGHWGWDMWDTVNQYVSVGVDGGLVCLLLFVLIISYCFKYIGTALKFVDNVEDKKIIWALGVVNFTHIVAFMGISYFDQMIVPWLLLISIIASMKKIFNVNNINQKYSITANV